MLKHKLLDILTKLHKKEEKKTSSLRYIIKNKTRECAVFIIKF